MKKLLLVLIAFCVLSPAGAVFAGEPALMIEIFCKPGKNKMYITNNTWENADVRFDIGYPEGTYSGRLSNEASTLLEKGLANQREEIIDVCGESVDVELAEEAVKIWAKKVLDGRAGLALVIALSPAEPLLKTVDNRDIIWSSWGYPTSRNLLGPKRLYWQEDTNITVIYAEQSWFWNASNRVLFPLYLAVEWLYSLIGTP